MLIGRFYFPALATICCILSVQACSTQKRPKEKQVVYEYSKGKTAYVAENGLAIAPEKAPDRVKRMIAAANSIVGKPYKRGGGHGVPNDTGYDCSGATSYVLRAGGLLKSSMPSKAFLKYGEKGYGKWVTIYVRDGHVFLVIAGLRFDTQGERAGGGPAWKPQKRNVQKFYVRHPKGL